jgi:hypothetical protein
MTTQGIESGPACENCAKAYMKGIDKGRAVGIDVAIEHVKKNGGSADLLKSLKKL